LKDESGILSVTSLPKKGKAVKEDLKDDREF
jgi:hypothetical protein